MIIIQFIIIIVPLLLSIATATLLERKVMAAIQLRRGPNVRGFGILQPLADGLKLVLKEFVIPLRANSIIFMVSPVLFLGLMLCLWSLIPFTEFSVVIPEFSLLLFLVLSSLSVYGIIFGGWSSNSRYAFLGAVRSASQMLSYELNAGLIVIWICILSKSFNFMDIVHAQKEIWFIVPLLPLFLIFAVAVLAESNRTPFDLPESESELVAGYSVEYSSIPFALYFIAEYGTILLWSHVTVILFLGGWFFILSLPSILILEFKAICITILFCWIRATLPRYRWDQLMFLAWRILLPICLIVTALLLILLRFNLFSTWFLYDSVDLSLVDIFRTVSELITYIYSQPVDYNNNILITLG